MAALAAPMLKMRMSKEEHVTLGLSLRLVPWKVGSSLLGPTRCKGICQLPCNHKCLSFQQLLYEAEPT